jgi:hypothetical protein
MPETATAASITERWASVEQELTAAAARVHERDNAAAVARRADEQVVAIEDEYFAARAAADIEEHEEQQLRRVTFRSILAILKGARGTELERERAALAVDLARTVDRALARFRRELGDVRLDAVTGSLDLSAGTRFVDSWFDNIFTDLSVGSRISAARDHAERLRQTVVRAVAECSTQLANVERRDAQLQEERSTILRSASGPR